MASIPLTVNANDGGSTDFILDSAPDGTGYTVTVKHEGVLSPEEFRFAVLPTVVTYDARPSRLLIKMTTTRPSSPPASGQIRVLATPNEGGDPIFDSGLLDADFVTTQAPAAGAAGPAQPLFLTDGEQEVTLALVGLWRVTGGSVPAATYGTWALNRGAQMPGGQFWLALHCTAGAARRAVPKPPSSTPVSTISVTLESDGILPYADPVPLPIEFIDIDGTVL